MNTETGKMVWTQLWLLPEWAGAPETLVEGHADSFEEWAEENPSHNQGQAWKDAQMFYTVMAMFDFEADRRGWSLDEIRLQRKDGGGVLAILKASKGKRKVVAFVGGNNFYDCWQEIQETKRREGFDWKPDKYAKF